MIKAIFFDLDGTLLQMDEMVFVKVYFGALAKKMATVGLDPKKMIEALKKGTEAMVKNDGTKTNEERFFQVFDEILEIDHQDYMNTFEDFYANEFDVAKVACSANTDALKVVEYVKEVGLRCILSTNPLFPEMATMKRIAWAQLNKNDFEWITTYEKCCYCKPNPKYYQEVLDHCGLKANEVIMVGNNPIEDGAAKQVGIATCLITEEAIKDDSFAFVGSMKELLNYLKNTCEILVK